MRNLFLLLLCLNLSLGFSQTNKVVVVEGEATYVGEPTESPLEVEEKALKNARGAALADKFGTHINQQTHTYIQNTNGNSVVDFTMLGSSVVGGEWLGDLEEPKFTRYFSEKDNSFVVVCKVKGKARANIGNRIDFKAQVYRNGIEKKDASNEFRKDIDNLYMSFQSPVSGYFTIYLVVEDKVYCMLPYRSDTDGMVKIKGGDKYILFHPEYSKPLYHKDDVDEYYFTDEETKNLFLYVVFSPNLFTKANDYAEKSEDGTERPRSLPLDEFKDWLLKNCVRDVNMQYDIHVIRLNP